MSKNIVKVGWLSDTQIGFCQYGMMRRRADFAKAYLRTIADMIDSNVNVIIHTGDLLNANRPAPIDVECLKTADKWLTEARVQMLVVSGNHDPSDLNWAHVAKTSDDPHVGYRMMDTRDGNPLILGGLSFHGLPFMHRNELLKIFPNLKGDVLMLHQTVKEFVGFPGDNMLSMSELPTEQFQAITMGDIHLNDVRQVPTNNEEFKNTCYVGYPGATELNSESEPSEKVWKMLVFEDGKLNRIEDNIIYTRPVLRMTIRNPEDLEIAVTVIQEHMDDPNEIDFPIVFVSYRYDVPDVIKRLRENFDPDKFIFQFSPLFDKEVIENGETKIVTPEDNLTVDDIRKSMVQKDSNLFGISELLMKPELTNDEAGMALDAFVESELLKHAQSE